jgi:probable F420-dependent oxidoreductase
VFVRYFFHYPETSGVDGELLDAGPLGEVAAAAERAGFDGFSLTEHPVPSARWLAGGGHQSLDPLVALGFVAAATRHLRLLTHVVVAPYRNPFLLAKAAATLDTLSGGRLILGLGAGYQKSEFFALGVDLQERNDLFDEALEVLPLHWSGEPFSYRGRHFDARDVIARPRPVQQPIPIWIGGNSPRGRRRVAERAQGWMPMLGSAELSATARTVPITSLAHLAGLIAELPDRIDVLCAYQDPSLATPAAEADRHRAALAELEQAGVTCVLVSCRTRTTAATLDFLAEFGETYLRR